MKNKRSKEEIEEALELYDKYHPNRKNKKETKSKYEMMRENLIKERGDKCSRCSVSRYEKRLIVHHIKPKKRGGSDNPENLRVLCDACHSIVHNHGMVVRIDRDLLDWVKGYGPTMNKGLRYIKGMIESREI